jgi:hypothetical protein
LNKKVSIIIVTWNAKEFLRQCLYSVYRETQEIAFEVFVVDNASSDGTVEMVEKEFPKVRLIKSDRNLGFAPANNIALRPVLEEKSSDFILLLNSDAVIRDRAVERLASYLEQTPEAGAAGPALVLPDGKFQPGIGGFLPAGRTGFHYFFFLFKLFPGRVKSLFIDQASFAKKKKIARVEWLSGACLMLRRQAVEKIGLMNEDYFFYLDDIDWGKRMKEAGVAIHYFPEARVLHLHGVTYKKILKEANIRWLELLYHYVREERGVWEYRAFRFFSVCGFFLRLVIRAVPFALKRDESRRRKIREMSGFFVFSLRADISRTSPPKLQNL